MEANTFSEDHKLGGWIQTYTGGKFYPLAPRVEDVRIEDIAHALANQCRFSGHTKVHYSVAQHSSLVARECSLANQLVGLLHDAAEAYLVDLPRPIKQMLRSLDIRIFDQIEEKIQTTILARFGLPSGIPEEVHQKDRLLLVTEGRDLMAPLQPDWIYQESNGYPALAFPIQPWTPQFAEEWFLYYFRLYSNQKEAQLG